jgi:hypothetical protein
MAHFLEGCGLRETERLVGVSHNTVMNWATQQLRDQFLLHAGRANVQWVKAAELCTLIAKTKKLSCFGGILVVLPKRFVEERWAIVVPRRPSSWIRNFLKAQTSSKRPTKVRR